MSYMDITDENIVYHVPSSLDVSLMYVWVIFDDKGMCSETRIVFFCYLITVSNPSLHTALN